MRRKLKFKIDLDGIDVEVRVEFGGTAGALYFVAGEEVGRDDFLALIQTFKLMASA